MARDWNAAYEGGDTPWDKGYASPPLIEFLKLQPISGRVLVPGCGAGHDVRALSAEGAEVVGLDIAPRGINKAENFPVSCGERYELGDFLNLGKQYHQAFDWIVEHTCLCAIDPSEREAYARSVAQALKPDGKYLAIFFREVSDYQGNGPPHPISREQSDIMFGNSFELIKSYVPQQTYPSRVIGAEEVCWMRLKA
jgi:SAM-dependent methyltransferase